MDNMKLKKKKKRVEKLEIRKNQFRKEMVKKWSFLNVFLLWLYSSGNFPIHIVSQ